MSVPPICSTCQGSPCSCSSSRGVDPYCCGLSARGASCGCNQMVQASAQPFYECAPCVQQSNQQKVFFQEFVSALKAVNSWNIPACGESATVDIPGLKAVVIGSYLWNPTYGYFEITSFNSGTQQVTVLNHCDDENAAAGTAVPSCTYFAITDTPPMSGNAGNVCLAVDFTAPSVGSPIDITLTSLQGLSAGDTVQIGSGFYTVNAVKPNNIITIVNTGDGITPGTAVIALNANGDYNYCLIILSQTPCDRDSSSPGTLITCNGSGLETRLKVYNQGWAPLAIDATFDQAQFKPIGLTPTCTTITSQIPIVNGTAAYSMNVVSTTGFAMGDVLQIAGYIDTLPTNTARFTITSVNSGTSLTGFISPTPGANVNIPIGTPICRIGCCELLQEQITARGFSYSDGNVFLGAATLTAGSPVFTTAAQVFTTITNTSKTSSMVVFGSIVGFFGIDSTFPDGTAWQGILAHLQTNVNGGAFADVFSFYSTIFKRDSGPVYIQVPGSIRPVVNLLPGTGATISARLVISRATASEGTSTIAVLNSGINGYVQGQLI